VAAERKIDFILDGSKEIFLKGDRIKLKQLFSNLIDNAIKDTPAGGKLSLSSQSENDRVKTILQDTGIGIPEDDLPHIFDRFYRVDKSRSRQSGGIGLGLSICQWIVKAHQGSIEVKSQLNQGTAFTVILPTDLT
jgi:signal transduction histidine kinase